MDDQLPSAVKDAWKQIAFDAACCGPLAIQERLKQYGSNCPVIRLLRTWVGSDVIGYTDKLVYSVAIKYSLDGQEGLYVFSVRNSSVIEFTHYTDVLEWMAARQRTMPELAKYPHNADEATAKKVNAHIREVTGYEVHLMDFAVHMSSDNLLWFPVTRRGEIANNKFLDEYRRLESEDKKLPRL